MSKITPQVNWQSADVSSRHAPLISPSAKLTSDVGTTAFTRNRRFLDAVQIVGVPSVVGATTPKEDAIGLLILAAEIEHALMVQYLYSALSLRRGDAQMVRNIAIQEMGHLITVQNLLLALTGINAEGIPALVHLGRDSWRKQSNYNPSQFRLERVTHTTLAKFVVIERPEKISSTALRTRLEALEREAEQDGAAVNPIFALYAALRWILQPCDAPTQSREFTVDMGFRAGWHLNDEDFAEAEVIDRFASTLDEWQSMPGLIVGVAHNVREAAAIVDAISAQGEGLAGNQDSHFCSFLELLNRFEAGRVRVRSLPRTPYVPGQLTVVDPFATEISNPYSVQWAHLFNLQYEILLIDIAWAISQPRDNCNRKALVDLTIYEMNQILRPLASALTKKPLSETTSLKAGPPYGQYDESIPSTSAGFRRRFDSLLKRQREIVEDILAKPEYLENVLDQDLVRSLKEINNTRARYLPQEV